MASHSVSLSPDELYQALIVGGHRRISCLYQRNKAQHYDAAEGNEWATEVEACCAELAVCRLLNKYWTGGTFDGKRAACDVDGKQVRHTTCATGHLIIYPEDGPEEVFILVTGKAPHYEVRGWLRAREAMDQGTDHPWWLAPENKRSPSWWVPQSALHPVPDKRLHLINQGQA